MQNITVLCKNYRNSEFWLKTILLYAKHRVEKIVTFGVKLIAMLNPRENMVVIDGQIKTANILHISTNNRMNGYDIVFNKTTRKTFSYGRNRAMWLTNPVIFDPQHCHIYHNGRQLWPLAWLRHRFALHLTLLLQRRFALFSVRHLYLSYRASYARRRIKRYNKYWNSDRAKELRSKE